MAPLKGGRSLSRPAPITQIGSKDQTGGGSYELTQPENPAQPSRQTISETTEQEESPNLPQAEPYGIVKASASDLPLTRKTKTTRVIDTQLGAAQKDVSREIGARLAAVRPIQFVGVLLMLAALAMFHPVVRAVTLSSTLQVATGVCGLVLVVLPMVVANNPMLFAWATILGITLPALWFFAHRHGRLQGFVDANKDGVDDRLQRSTAAPGNNPFADPSRYDVR